MHFGVVVAALPEYVEDFAPGALHCFGPFGDVHQHLLSVLVGMSLFQRDENVYGDLARIDLHEGEARREFHYAHIVAVGALENLEYLPFGNAALARTGDDEFHSVAVEGVGRVARGDEYVVVEPLHGHIHRARGEHVDHTFVGFPVEIGPEAVLAVHHLLHHALVDQRVDHLAGELPPFAVAAADGGG